jgi:hypothetical protein
MPADQTRSFHKKRHLGARCAEARSADPIRRPPQDTAKPTAVPATFHCSAAALGADEPERRESAAATTAWRTVHMSDVPNVDWSLGKGAGSVRVRRDSRCFVLDFKFCPKRGEPSKRQTHKAMPQSAPQVGVATSDRGRCRLTEPCALGRPQHFRQSRSALKGPSATALS